MAEEQDKSQQTEQASPKRLEDARKKGQVPSSKELSTAVSFLVLASIGVTGVGVWAGEHLIRMMRYYLTLNPAILETHGNGVRSLLGTMSVNMAEIFLPIVLPMMVLGVIAAFALSGPIFTFETLKPKLKKINPMSGIKRLFSTKGLADLVKSLIKLAVIFLASWIVLEALLPQIMRAGNGNIRGIAVLASRGTIELSVLVAMIFIPIAIADIFYQRWEHTKSMRMSKKEVKDENKDTEGDPQIKMKIRQIQQAQAKNRMMADVPKADVVITNPTRITVALAYKPGQAAAPKVLAKGKGEIAKKIREIARQHHIPIRENKPLARSLFTAVGIGEEIPENLYEAVAIILAEIFRLK